MLCHRRLKRNVARGKLGRIFNGRFASGVAAPAEQDPTGQLILFFLLRNMLFQISQRFQF